MCNCILLLHFTLASSCTLSSHSCTLTPSHSHTYPHTRTLTPSYPHTHTLVPKLSTVKLTRGSFTSRLQTVRSWWQLRESLLTTKSSRSSTSRRRCIVCVARSGVRDEPVCINNLIPMPSVTPFQFLCPHSQALLFVVFLPFLYCGFWTSCSTSIQTVVCRQPSLCFASNRKNSARHGKWFACVFFHVPTI